MTSEEILALCRGDESDRVEMTESFGKSEGSRDKICEAVCAFSNDFPDHRMSGYIIIGYNKKEEKIAGFEASDEVQLKLTGIIRDSGNILPLPALRFHKCNYPEGDILAIEVIPSDLPPVSYKGRVYIWIGPSKKIATRSEENILESKRHSKSKSFDASPCKDATIDDLALELFKINYRSFAVSQETIDENHRTDKEQLAALKFYDLVEDCPTHAGILAFGKNPLNFISGAYIQFVVFDGNDLTSTPIIDKVISGDLFTVIRSMEELLKSQNSRIFTPSDGFRELRTEPYPFAAMRELVLNAIMHRDYRSNANIRLYFFQDHVEIQNPGGLYGEVNRRNFPRMNDYRNPIIATIMKTWGFVEQFGRGIQRAVQLFEKNENEVSWDLDKSEPDYFLIKIYRPEK
jgi:ATP-dependent DNA helicase RecG